MFPYYGFSLFNRAQKRLEGECVFGNPISVGIPQRGSCPMSDGQHNMLYNGAVRDSSCMNYSMGLPSTWFQPNNFYGYYNGSSRSPVNCLGSSNTSPWVHMNNSAFSARNVHANSNSDAGMPSGSNSHGYDCPQLNNHLDNLRSTNLLSMEEVEHSMSRSSSNKTAPPKVPGKYVNQLETRKCRSPSPFSSYSQNQQYFSPIPDARSLPGTSVNSSTVELNISNLDHKISGTEMKQILLNLFSKHVKVVDLMMYTQSDGHYAASVKVGSLQEAQVAVSKLHRLKLGSKKIMISYAATGQHHDPQFIRWQVVNLMRDIPGFKLPLFKFIELFESRYSNAISLSELHRLKDVVSVIEDSSGRMLSLNVEHRNRPSPNLSQDVETFCALHYRGNEGCGWAEKEMPCLPRVRVRLQKFSQSINSLIASHNGSLPLSSIYDCYVAECGELEENANGAALEHLVTCVPNVQLVQSSNMIKYLKHGQDSSQGAGESELSTMYPELASQISMFGKEAVELLHSNPQCQLPFYKFIPAYHHYFGRQCRVANYGFTKLIDLLQALPSTIQVMGDGDRRVVTLSHRAQVRRFTTDVIRAVRSRASHQLLLSELPLVFAKVVGKKLEPTDYGLCYVEDLIALVPSSAITVSEEHGQLCISLPKRTQAPTEAKRTLEFTKEVITLLSYYPQCSIRFNKFIPAYHHHFGYQCRVADYGFTKLFELFEAIPDIVEVEEMDGEKWVSLRQKHKMQVLEEKIGSLVAVRYPPGLQLASLQAAFLWKYGYSLKPEVYSASNLHQLISHLSSLKVASVDGLETLVPADEGGLMVSLLERQVLRALIDSPDGSMTLSSLAAMFNKCFSPHFTPSALTALMNNKVEVEEVGGDVRVRLVGTGEEARRLCLLLREAPDSRMALSDLEESYLQHWGHRVPVHGHDSVAALLRSLPDLINLRGKQPHLIVHLHKNFHGNGSRISVLQSGAPGFLFENNQVNKMKEDTPVLESPPKWLSIWSNRLNSDDFDNQVPVVNMPHLATPPANIVKDSELISPCKGLLPATIHPMLIAPDPSQLPSPHQIYSLPKEGQNEDQMNKSTRNVNQVTPTSSIGKRKLKLAAQFQTPIGSS